MTQPVLVVTSVILKEVEDGSTAGYLTLDETRQQAFFQPAAVLLSAAEASRRVVITHRPAPPLRLRCFSRKFRPQ